MFRDMRIHPISELPNRYRHYVPTPQRKGNQFWVAWPIGNSNGHRPDLWYRDTTDLSLACSLMTLPFVEPEVAGCNLGLRPPRREEPDLCNHGFKLPDSVVRSF
ncbi:hypothetical protein Pan258_50430 [Symmachiella dynata]|uniref:Uncharacterized protein n=1 Tax=Symmachiella dynata TaxID=2527995 RepID=A0A517ZW18_9PLAN|nr:hypothetical protein Pan258_50430 [Symmachiella dynata]QDU46641.1 hypothetical protein Mal52_51630 [Symmachiella dynata]